MEKSGKQNSRKNTYIDDKYKPEEITSMIYGTLYTYEQLEAQHAEAAAVRSGQVDYEQIAADADEGSIPPSWSKRFATPTPTSR